MERRALLARAGRLGLVLGAAVLLPGHTPYRQWVVYRKRHLLVLASRQDPQAYALCRELAADLAAALPKSRARPSRAGSHERLASLLATGQMDVAVLSPAKVRELRAGQGAGRDAGTIDLRLLLELEQGYLLVARADYPERHAYRVGQALAGEGARRLPLLKGGLPLHPGVEALIAGRPLPAPPPEPAVPLEEAGHSHR